jgi:hypothetical protein
MKVTTYKCRRDRCYAGPPRILEIDFRRDTTPLIAEVSADRASWAVARSERDFGSWKPTFPARTARCVRLRVPRRSLLHLQAIAAR